MIARMHEQQGGAVAVLYSVVLLMLLGMVAIVIDLGAMRYERGHSQATADLASLAGGLDLFSEAQQTVTPADACRKAFEYFLQNTVLVPSRNPTDYTDFCAGLPETMDSACDTYTQTTVYTDEVEPYRVAITWPIPNGSEWLTNRHPYDEAVDGTDACERLAVQVARTQGFIFGGAVGQTQGNVAAPAVVRVMTGSKNKDVASLLLLDKIGCRVLRTTGTASLRVLAAKFDPDGDGPELGEDIPGRIYVDSDGSKSANPNRCGNDNDVTITTSGGGYIVADGDDQDPPAPGVIRLFAMPRGASSCTTGEHDCTQSEVATTPPPAHPGVPGSGIWPQPQDLPERTNRTPADHTYNCKPSYPDLQAQAPYGLDWDVPSCNGTTSAYVDQLEAQLGNAGTQPSGFQRWRGVFGDDACDASKATVPAGMTLQDIQGNWYVDCPNGFSLGGADVRFTGGNVVFAGGITNSGGRLDFNTNNPTPTLMDPDPDAPVDPCLQTVTGCLTASSSQMGFVYLGGNPDNGCQPNRTNNLEQTGGEMNFNRVALFIRDGAVKLNGGTYNWTSPDEGPFEDLALWGDNRPACEDLFVYRGTGAVVMLGVFFTPNATTDIAGGAGQTPREAQFFTWRMDITGGGALLMRPNPEKALPVKTFEGVRLIR